METFFLICFLVGLILSVLSVVGGFSHLHIGRVHIGHTAHAHPHGSSHGLSSVNGFTVTAFISWFGAAGYLLYHYTAFLAPMILLLATISGFIGAAALWAVLFKLLLPRERVLTTEDTEMPGVIAHVSDSIRDNGIGEIIFSQTGARRATAARSEDGTPIQRGTEVLVIRYERGIAYVRRFDELSHSHLDELNDSRA